MSRLACGTPVFEAPFLNLAEQHERGLAPIVIRSRHHTRSVRVRACALDPVYYDWAKIKVRTLVLGGDKDTPNFPEQAKHIADTIPNGELALLPNLGRPVLARITCRPSC